MSALQAPAAGAAVPDAPAAFRITALTADHVTFTWAAANATDASVTGYELQRSVDDGHTWADTPDGATQDTTLTIAAPSAGQFLWFRVVAESAAGPSDPSEPASMFRPGTTTQRFVVQTETGAPVTHATVEWSDGYGTWSTTRYHLNADGAVNLPGVPAGYSMLVRISDGYLPNGNTVAHEWEVNFGTAPQTLVVPMPPPMQSRRVHVVMPNGVPVVGAEVNATYYHALNDVIETNGYTYGSLDALWDDTTDATGTATVRGWSAQGMVFLPPPKYKWPQEAVLVYYNDGVLHQESDFLLTGDDTTVQLNPMPWLTTGTPDTGTAGQQMSLVFKAHRSQATRSQATRSSRAAATAGSLAGITVSVQPPAGWSAKRCRTHSTLSGRTNASGRITLHVCGSRSGSFRVHTHGAVPTGTLTVRVRHTPPLAPAGLSVASSAKGKLTVSWHRPSYNGGASVSSYRVVLSAAGQRSHSYSMSASSFTRTFSGLTRAIAWKASVQATNKFGTGGAATRSVRVM